MAPSHALRVEINGIIRRAVGPRGRGQGAVGIRHKDWSGFGDYPEPDREDAHDWASRTGRYSYRRHFEDRHLHDTDHIRNHDRNLPDHGAAFSS